MEISSTNPVKMTSTPRPASAADQPVARDREAAAPATPAVSVDLQGRNPAQTGDQSEDPSSHLAAYTAAPAAASGGAKRGDQPADSGTDAAAGTDVPPSGLKSFGYGALGVSAPKDMPTSGEDAYSAGQWTGAALKIGGIIAILA